MFSKSEKLNLFFKINTTNKILSMPNRERVESWIVEVLAEWGRIPLVWTASLGGLLYKENIPIVHNLVR